jgi:hypothetical protein
MSMLRGVSCVVAALEAAAEGDVSACVLAGGEQFMVKVGEVE